MRIGLYGYTDKRPFLYTLMCALQVSGEVAVITQNRHLKRLISDYSELGHFGNVLICVTDWTPDEVWARIGQDPDDFDHVIYDLTDTVADTDKDIFILGSEYEDGQEDFVEMLENVDKVKLMYDGKSGPTGYVNIPIDAGYLGSVELMERNKVYTTFNNKQLNIAVAKLIAEDIEQTPQNVVKYLARLARKG